MSLFSCTPAGAEGAGKRRMGPDGQPVSTDGGAPTLESRLKAVEELTTSMGQLVVVHDTRLRELGTLFRVLMFPKGSSYAVAAEEVNEGWKTETKEYYKRRDKGDASSTLGNKHLRLGAVLLNQLWRDPQTKEAIKERMRTHWQGKDTSTPDFLGTDIKIMKWRMARNGKQGILEFKLTESLMEVEEEFIRVTTQQGAVLRTDPAPRGDRVRDLEAKLEGAWERK